MSTWIVKVSVTEYSDGYEGEHYSDEVAAFEGDDADEEAVPFAAELRQRAYDMKESTDWQADYEEQE